MTGGKVGSPVMPGSIGSKKRQAAVPSGAKSPFFRPSTPTEIQQITTPGGSKKLVVERKKDTQETKSTLMGAYANLVSVIVGAGIVAIPFAIRETGLVAGLVMIFLVAIITQKSLCLLIETGKHVDAPSYETLLEAAFGRKGFLFISLNMFLMNFGSMVSYLIILKVTITEVLGISPDNLFLKRAVLVGSSCLIILPLSMQRDMADLSWTSSICVLCDIIMVLIIAVFSPAKESITFPKQFLSAALDSTFHPETFFIGLGVLSFAFVCQDSCFIIAGSLKNPTRQRWRTVTAVALGTCALLATVCGTCGFLGFRSATVGNILHNFEAVDDHKTQIAANIARGLLGTTMFFVFPLASFVVRHICVVLFFHGQRAHDGDDHTILARTDRRIAVTCFLYVLALMPALLFESLGTVLAFTGAIGGSCLSYIGPGIAYLGIHGDEFLVIVKKYWPNRPRFLVCFPGVPQRFKASSQKKLQKIEESTLPADGTRRLSENSSLLDESAKQPGEDAFENEVEDNDACVHGPWCLTTVFTESIRVFTWFFLLMPIWCWIATTGQEGLTEYMEKQERKSPKTYRLGRVAHRKRQLQKQLHEKLHSLQQRSQHQQRSTSLSSMERQVSQGDESIGSDEDPAQDMRLLLHSNSDSEILEVQQKFRSLSDDHIVPAYFPPKNFNENPSYGTITGITNETTPSESLTKKQWGPKKLMDRLRQVATPDITDGVDVLIEDDPQENFPTLFDFVIAVGYIILGVVAFTAGIVSIVMS